jgi:hypothetical protein
MCGRSFVLAGAMASLVGAGTLASGCDSRSTPPKHLAVVRESCAVSWVPTAETFKGFGKDWRRSSVRIGPITLMGARAAAHRNVAAYGSIKFRTLVRPRTPVTVEIGQAARSAVGFVAPPAFQPVWPKHGAAILRLAPCRADFLPVRGLLLIGYPMFLRVRHNACTQFKVSGTRSGRSARATVSIGAGRCRA